MKKTVALSLIFFLGFLFASCGSIANNTTTQNPTPVVITPDITFTELLDHSNYIDGTVTTHWSSNTFTLQTFDGRTLTFDCSDGSLHFWYGAFGYGEGNMWDNGDEIRVYFNGTITQEDTSAARIKTIAHLQEEIISPLAVGNGPSHLTVKEVEDGLQTALSAYETMQNPAVSNPDEAILALLAHHSITGMERKILPSGMPYYTNGKLYATCGFCLCADKEFYVGISTNSPEEAMAHGLGMNYIFFVDIETGKVVSDYYRWYGEEEDVDFSAF